VNHPYEKYAVDLYLYECKLLSDTLHRHAVNDYAWVTSKEMESYSFTPVDEASMSKLLGEI
jgi:8-oxo-dGTP diphosphatase